MPINLPRHSLDTSHHVFQQVVLTGRINIIQIRRQEGRGRWQSTNFPRSMRRPPKDLPRSLERCCTWTNHFGGVVACFNNPGMYKFEYSEWQQHVKLKLRKNCCCFTPRTPVLFSPIFKFYWKGENADKN